MLKTRSFISEEKNSSKNCLALSRTLCYNCSKIWLLISPTVATLGDGLLQNANCQPLSSFNWKPDCSIKHGTLRKSLLRVSLKQFRLRSLFTEESSAQIKLKLLRSSVTFTTHYPSEWLSTGRGGGGFKGENRDCGWPGRANWGDNCQIMADLFSGRAQWS